jgi:hypothetical protein
MEISILVVWLALCGVAAYIAGNKGRSGAGIFFLSFFLSPLVGLIVALAMSPDAAALGKKKCPNCAEFVQPDAKICRFCQHSFVEEEAAERARLEAERVRLETEQATAKAREQEEYAAQQAVEAAKPWLQRNWGILCMLTVVFGLFGGGTWYAYKYPQSPGSLTDAKSENKPAPPAWVTEERSKIPKSVWDKRVAWAVQHHCYFIAMSRDEIVQALGEPTEEASYDLTYKRQTQECVRYNGDACSEYKTEKQIIFLKDGYEDKELSSGGGCRTLYGDSHYLGLEIPAFRPPKTNAAGMLNPKTRASEAKPPTAEEAASWHTKEYCEANGFVWNEEHPTRCLLKKRPTGAAEWNSTQTRELCESRGMFWVESDSETQERGCWSQLPERQ